MRLLSLAAALGLALCASSANAAVTINFAGGSGAVATGTTVFEDFNEFAPHSSVGTLSLVLAKSTGSGAMPNAGDGSQFLSVLQHGSYTATFAATTVFSFLLGSLDKYNTLELSYADGSSSGPLAGNAIIGGLAYDEGSRTSSTTNGVVTYTVAGGPKIVGATFRSGANSFEVDNLAVASAAPELSTWALMILGFGAAGVGLRRRRIKVSHAF